MKGKIIAGVLAVVVIGGGVWFGVTKNKIEENKKSSEETISNQENLLKNDISYVGYYADIDGDEIVDGVVYADLAVGGSGEWLKEEGIYNIPVGDNFKKYTISENTYSGDFGEKEIITATTLDGNDRFYVMALKDIDEAQYNCYFSATGNMTDYNTTTSTDFGSGKENTTVMIKKWNNSEYGKQNGGSALIDMWGIVEKNIGTKWFVPSKEELCAFSACFDITSENYHSKYNLSKYYLSSSQYSKNSMWGVTYVLNDARSLSMDVGYYVRLSASF